MNGKNEILKDDSPLHSPGRGQVAPGSPCSTHWLWAPKAAEKQATELQSQCQRERKNGQKPHGNNISHQRDCAVWPLRRNCPPRRKQLSLAPNSHRLALTHCNTPGAGGHEGSDHPTHKTKTKAKIDMG